MDQINEKDIFTSYWKSCENRDKLDLYGVAKLKKLACKKKIKNYVLLKRDELLRELEPLVEEKDLPIK